MGQPQLHPTLLGRVQTGVPAKPDPSRPRRRGDGALYRWWRREIENLGYSAQEVFLNSAVLGAPSWRDRMYVVAWQHGLPTPDLQHRADANCARCGPQLALQTFKPPTRAWPLNRWGRLGAQYDYRCPSCNTTVQPSVRGAWEIIDWADLGFRVADREAAGLRPLAASTLRRIELGVQQARNAPAVLIENGAARLQKTQPATMGQQVLWAAQVKQNGRSGDTACHGLDRPLRTITAYQDTTAVICTQAPLIGLVDCHTSRTRTAAEPLAAILTHEQQAQLALPLPNDPDSPLPVEEAHYRMLHPHELKLGMSFRADFDLLDGSLPKRARVKAVGNAVTPVTSQWLATQVLSSVFC